MPGMEPAVESPTPLKCCWACCSMGMPPEYGVSRKIERATYEAVLVRFIAGNLHPDHDTLASFRRTFLPELKDLFVQVLLLAKAGGCAEAGGDQSGRDQDPCRCLQAQGGQLQAAAGGGGAAAERGPGAGRASVNRAASQRAPVGWWGATRLRGARIVWDGGRGSGESADRGMRALQSPQ